MRSKSVQSNNQCKSLPAAGRCDSDYLRYCKSTWWGAKGGNERGGRNRVYYSITCLNH